MAIRRPLVQIGGELAELPAGDIIIPDATILTAYTPVVAANTGTITTYTVNSAAYKATGKIVFVRLDVTLTTVGTAAGFITITLPVNALTLQALSGLEVAINGAVLRCVTVTGVVNVKKYDNTFFAANGYQFIISGSYESV